MGAASLPYGASTLPVYTRESKGEDTSTGSKTLTSTPHCGGHLNEDVDTRWADLLLLSSYLITGILDSVAVHTWGSFVSMQTGNTVYIGLGLAAPSASKRWIKSLTSVVFFCFGSFCFSRFHRKFHPRRRWVLAASFGIQGIFVCFSALIVSFLDSPVHPQLVSPSAAPSLTALGSSGSTPTSPSPALPVDELRWQVLAPIAIIAFQSSAQAQVSRAVGFESLTSVVLTSIYCDLFGDVNLFASLRENTERNHRIAAPLLLCLGAIVGGWWAETEGGEGGGVAGALWTAAALKVAMLLAWLLWPPRQ